MCFFYFLENVTCNRPVINFSGVLILVLRKTILLGNAEFIADISSHAETAKLYRLFLCREAEQNTIHGSYIGIVLAQGINNCLSFRGIHIWSHIFDTIHSDPAGCIGEEDRDNIKFITAGDHQLYFLSILGSLHWKKLYFNMIFRNHIFVHGILYCGTCCVVLLIKLNIREYQVIWIFFGIFAKICFCYRSIR